MTAIGVCLDALNPVASPTPAAYPFKVARLVAFLDAGFYAYCAQLTAHGTAIWLVFTDQSYEQTVTGFTRVAITRTICAKVRPTYVTLGNEPDLTGKSSNTKSVELYAEFWAEVAPTVPPSAVLLLGGFGSGQPAVVGDYLHALPHTRPMGIDVHLYAQDPDAAAELLTDYLFAGDLPVYVGEWSRPVAEIAPMVATFVVAGVRAACWFDWSDDQIDQPYGIIDHDGNPKPEYAALVTAAQGAAMSTATPDGSEIKKLIAAYPNDIGALYGTGPNRDQPIRVTQPGGWPPLGSLVLPCDGGVMLEVPGIPGAYCQADGPGLIAGKFRATP